MAKRGRKSSHLSIDSLIFELRRLDSRREAVAAQIGEAVTSLVSLDAPLPRRTGQPLKPATRSAKKAVKTGASKSKMSAEARRRISEAQKARWAKLKGKGAKKKTD